MRLAERCDDEKPVIDLDKMKNLGDLDLIACYYNLRYGPWPKDTTLRASALHAANGAARAIRG
jgi:hypothetical protein